MANVIILHLQVHFLMQEALKFKRIAMSNRIFADFHTLAWKERI